MLPNDSCKPHGACSVWFDHLRGAAKKDGMELEVDIFADLYSSLLE